MEEQIEQLKRISFIRGNLQAMGKVMQKFQEKKLTNKAISEALMEIFSEYQSEYDEANAKTGNNQ